MCGSFLLLVSGLSCESLIYPRIALYVCAPVLLLLAGSSLLIRPVPRYIPVFAHYVIVACLPFFYVFQSAPFSAILFLSLPAVSKMTVGK